MGTVSIRELSRNASSVRVGDWRVLYRPRSAVESANAGPGYIVARVVNRRDLLRAVSTLS